MSTVHAVQNFDGLRIVVLEGEDSVNIIAQGTAVPTLVEVRDRKRCAGSRRVGCLPAAGWGHDGYAERRPVAGGADDERFGAEPNDRSTAAPHSTGRRRDCRRTVFGSLKFSDTAGCSPLDLITPLQDFQFDAGDGTLDVLGDQSRPQSKNGDEDAQEPVPKPPVVLPVTKLDDLNHEVERGALTSNHNCLSCAVKIRSVWCLAVRAGHLLDLMPEAGHRTVNPAVSGCEGPTLARRASTPAPAGEPPRSARLSCSRRHGRAFHLQADVPGLRPDSATCAQSRSLAAILGPRST